MKGEKLEVRLTVIEKELIRAQAQLTGNTLSSYIKKLILEDLKRSGLLSRA